MKDIIYLFLIFLSLPARAQEFTKEQLTEDLIQLKEAIQTYNPALEIYNPDFISKVDGLISAISEETVSPIGAFNYISQLCAFSNEGHFSLGKWEDDAHAGFFNNEYRYLPISIRVLQGKLVLRLDVSMEQSLNLGDEILSINGLSSKDILDKLYKALPSDGRITTYADRKIERDFSWMFYLYVAQPDTFMIEIKDSSGTVKKHQIQPIIRKIQFDNYAKFYPDRANRNNEVDSFYTLKQERDVAYLTLPSFDFSRIEKFNIKSKQFYKNIFEELQEKKINNLVIDLRGNTGGRNELADDIVPFILKSGIEDSFLKKTISWFGKTRTYKFPRRSKLAFKGDIFVLVNGRTYSAGSMLARYLHEYGNATIIGEETGTRYEGFAAGSSQSVILKNSQIEIGIPRYHILMPKSKKQTTSNRGLLPQHSIEYSVEDILDKKDPYLEKVKSLILNK